MLPYYKLIERLGEAYDHALNDRVEEFKLIDDEVTSLVPLYIQQITYSSQAVIKLNNVQLSNIFTQTVKISFTLAALSAIIMVMMFIPFLEGAVSSILATASIGAGLFYVWKKIPVVRELWSNTKEVDTHSTMLYISLSDCVKSLSEIKGFHQSTIPTIEEWQRKGLWKNKVSEEVEEAAQSITDFLETLKSREHYKDD